MEKRCVLCVPHKQEEVVCESGRWRVIFADEPAWPGFCRVIWKAHVAEMTDLPRQARQELMEAVLAVEAAVREILRPDKVNLASLGNMAPHLHWHVIPRFGDDACFPESVWGRKQRETVPGVLKQRQALLPELAAAIRQRLQEAGCALL
ncbi:MAG: HIT family protein [Oxalobacter formigenes]|nr:HIT family protein [Oxalobacter formigenes]